MTRVVLILMLALLASCTRAQDAATLAEERTKQAKDIEAASLRTHPV